MSSMQIKIKIQTYFLLLNLLVLLIIIILNSVKMGFHVVTWPETGRKADVNFDSFLIHGQTKVP